MKTAMLATMVFGAVCCGQTRIDDPEVRITGPLVRAGIKLDDETALIRVLQRSREQPTLAPAAAYVLGKLPKNAVIVRELNIAAQSEDEILMNYAIRSLLKLGDREWVPAAAARLSNVRHRGSQLQLAGELASADRYDGWDMIEAAIVAGDIWQETALFEVGNFRGMKDASGKPIDLLAKLDELRLRTPTERGRNAIYQTIIRLGVEQMPPRPRSVKKSRQ